ncbi:hypothetical protein ABD86_10125 [Paenibacillus alvei]|nr:hypothetical protein [Paenibacillus alvei]
MSMHGRFYLYVTTGNPNPLWYVSLMIMHETIFLFYMQTIKKENTDFMIQITNLTKVPKNRPKMGGFRTKYDKIPD